MATPRSAVAAILDLVKRTQHLSVAEGFALMRSGDVAIYETMLAREDAQEGPQSFVEKRPPHWSGR